MVVAVFAVVPASARPESTPGPAAQKSLKLESSSRVDAKKNEKRAKDAVVGYYQALIKGDYETAGTFVHPDTIEPVRKSLVAEIDKARPAQKAATLKMLGVDDVNALNMLSMSQFFAVFARSSYGQTLQVMANPALAAAVAVVGVTCASDKDACDVEIEVETNTADGKRAKKKQRVSAEKVGGRWLAGARPQS